MISSFCRPCRHNRCDLFRKPLFRLRNFDTKDTVFRKFHTKFLFPPISFPGFPLIFRKTGGFPPPSLTWQEEETNKERLILSFGDRRFLPPLRAVVHFCLKICSKLFLDRSSNPGTAASALHPYPTNFQKLDRHRLAPSIDPHRPYARTKSRREQK